MTLPKKTGLSISERLIIFFLNLLEFTSGFQDAGEVHLCSELTSITSRRLEPAEPVSR